MNSRKSSENGPEAWLRTLQDRVDRLRFGVVQIVVHDSRVVQIEWTEKVRFDGIEAGAAREDRQRGKAGFASAQLEAV